MFTAHLPTDPIGHHSSLPLVTGIRQWRMTRERKCLPATKSAPPAMSNVGLQGRSPVIDVVKAEAGDGSQGGWKVLQAEGKIFDGGSHVVFALTSGCLNSGGLRGLVKNL